MPITTFAAVLGALVAQRPTPQLNPTVRRAVGWWWVGDAAEDADVEAMLKFVTANHDIVSSLIMRCGVVTCVRTKTRGVCTNNNGTGGVITGTLSPACKAVIPKLVALGITPEIWLGEDDSLSSARHLIAHPDSTAAALLAVAQSAPGIGGFNIDLETSAGTAADAAALGHFLDAVATKLSGSGIRFTADVSCTAGAGWAPLISNCTALARLSGGKARLLNMRTYNAASYEEWYFTLLPPALSVPRQSLGAGLGCWVDSRTNGTWSVTQASAVERVCTLMNASVEEIDMFVLNPLRGFPESFWLPELRKFMAGGGCMKTVPKRTVCPQASVGPPGAWTPGYDPGCCTSMSERGNGAHCNISCAEAECSTAKGHWKPANYSHHPYECCMTPQTS